jgi:stress-induced morphogen
MALCRTLLHPNQACSQDRMVDPDEVRRRIEAALPGARVAVADTTGAGDHFEVRVAAAAFAGIGLVEQHRMVYAALGDLMPRIHALQLKTEAEGEGAR